MRRLLLAAGLLLASLVAWADVPPIPALTARVTDLTATLSGDQRQHLEQQLAALETKSGAQVAVLLVPTTGDESIEEYAVRTFEKWKLGQKKVDDGVLLLVAKNDRTLRIEVGYGLEGAITDVQAGRIISEQITPQFRQGNFYGGIQAGVDSLVQLIDAEKNPDSAASAPPDALPAIPEATPPRALPKPIEERSMYDSTPAQPKKKSGLSGQLWDNPVYLGVYVAVLLAVALLGRLLPLQWMRRRSIGRFLLCSAAVAGLAWLLSMGLWQNVDRAADDSLGVLAPTLFIYALFLLPGEVLMAILSAILSSRGGGGGGGGSGGGGIFRGGGGSSGGGGASGRW
ncbi:TPM domain-containing protein [Pseudomonas paraeruginosa]|uniref:TPM domain-containing protein n=1 Tax=Pseudomonas paraeruginosa TaxID=2994495 RepID=UPI0039FD98A2